MVVQKCYNRDMSKVLKDKIEFALGQECTNQEQEILNYLASNIKSISSLTSKQVAEACFCSTSAVNRAVKKLDFKGFTEFKNFEMFSYSLEEQQVKPEERYTNYINMILDDIDYSEVETFAEEIKKLDMMYIYGNGVSNISSLFLFRQLLNNNYNVVYIPDLDMLTKLSHGTVICVSSIGTNDHVNDVLRSIDVDVLSITKKDTPQHELSRLSITHKIDYTNATVIEREQQIQLFLLIGALIDTLNE